MLDIQLFRVDQGGDPDKVWRRSLSLSLFLVLCAFPPPPFWSTNPHPLRAQIRESQRLRFSNVEWVDEVIAEDTKWRQCMGVHRDINHLSVVVSFANSFFPL